MRIEAPMLHADACRCAGARCYPRLHVERVLTSLRRPPPNGGAGPGGPQVAPWAWRFLEAWMHTAGYAMANRRQGFNQPWGVSTRFRAARPAARCGIGANCCVFSRLHAMESAARRSAQPQPSVISHTALYPNLPHQIGEGGEG